MRPRDFVLRRNIRHVTCFFSGGKDSLVSTHYTLSDIEDLQVNKVVVHVDTTCSLPGVQDYVREVAQRFGWNLRILRPKKSFWDLARRWGSPTMRRRWCCYYLKLEPIIRLVRELSRTGMVCEVLGLRREESSRRRNLPQFYSYWNRRYKYLTWKYAPIIDWSERDVDGYIERHKLPVNPIYRIVNSSGECVCGVYKSVRELDVLAAHFPEWFKRFVDLEESFRSGGTAFFKGRPVSAKEIARRKRLTDFIR